MRNSKKLIKSKNISGPDWKIMDSSSEDEEQWISKCRYVADKVENLLMAAGNHTSTEEGSDKKMMELNEEINDISTDISIDADHLLRGNEVVNQDIEELSGSDNDEMSSIVNDEEVQDRDYVNDETIEVTDNSIVESMIEIHGSDDNTVDTKGDSSPDENVEGFNLNKREGSKRNRKHLRMFTYDEVGKPSYS